MRIEDMNWLNNGGLGGWRIRLVDGINELIDELTGRRTS